MYERTKPVAKVPPALKARESVRFRLFPAINNTQAVLSPRQPNAPCVIRILNIKLVISLKEAFQWQIHLMKMIGKF